MLRERERRIIITGPLPLHLDAQRPLPSGDGAHSATPRWGKTRDSSVCSPAARHLAGYHNSVSLKQTIR